MDIAPTYAMYHKTDMDFARSYYHWFFLIQPYDLPERMIGQNPRYYLERKLGQWGRNPGGITGEAFEEYMRCFDAETIHASCEDYRASASIDLLHDQEDLDMGRSMECPLLCLWGEKGYVGQKYDVVEEWAPWTNSSIVGYALPCGHYVAEEAPKETLTQILTFLPSP